MVWAVRKKALLFTSSAVALSLAAGSAFAGGFALREQSSYYQGTSFAGNATSGPSVSSMFWNPAAITGVGEGFTFEAHNSFILPQAELNGTNTVLGTTLPVSTGDIGSDAWVGATYTTYRVNDDVVFGLGVNAPFGLSTKVENPNWAGAGYNRSSKVFSINVNPVVAYQFNDMISVAAGLQFQYVSVRLTNSAAAPGVFNASTTLQGDGLGYGVTAGLTLKPFKGTELGVGYRSAVGVDLDGNAFLPAGVPGRLAPGSYGITTSLVTPDMITVSAKQDITEDVRLLATFEWANWSRLKTPKIDEDTVGQISELPFNYDDGYFLALGAEYDWNDKLTLRAGGAYEWSPINETIRSARLPDNDRIWASLGASYKFNKHMSFDLGYTHIFGTDTNLNVGPGHQDYSATKGSLVADVDSSVDIFSASMRMSF
ncbi:long-chain fatty acid transporter [Roseibium aquae]|uniref:Long-chain fatty acid transporter n=1 Tax=Roseibium aquae TaxID=1323746 RepID=A0A916WW16_9HYPH|nr:outer membrane protein transport protein [Roseibium aquae]GGB37007.1 long-chain fatty acid transporter [Roseibium aquae]